MLDQAWQLSGSVALRPEPFGALAYDFRSRRLSFLKSSELVKVVKALGPDTTVRTALEDAGVPPERWPAYLTALQSLVDSHMLTPIAQEAVAS